MPVGLGIRTASLLLAGLSLAQVQAVSANDRSVVDDRRTGATVMSTLDADTMPSPGIAIGITSYDSQHNSAQGHQVASNPGSETVHFAWTMWDVIPSSADETNRFVNYNSWDKPSGTTNQGFNGTSISLGEFARGGMVRIDVDSENRCHAAFHQRIERNYPYSVWCIYFPIEGSALHNDSELPKSSAWPDEVEHLWPDIAVSQNHGLKDTGTDVLHVIGMGMVDAGGGYATPSDRFWYWRCDKGEALPMWEGPILIDSSRSLSYTMDAADDSGKVAIVFTSDYSTDNLNRLNNVAYRESRTSGSGWLNGSELGEAFKNFATAYDDTIGGTQAWTETSTAYDHRGVLHIVYTEQRAPGSEEIALRHWSNERGTIATVAEAYYTNPNTWGRDLNITRISLGIGDGATLCNGGAQSNEDYLYVLYTKLGGETPEEQADVSRLGYANGELYLTASNNNGDVWMRPVNLSNTKTPGCTVTHTDSVCASEAWATIARDVSDIEILYILDFEAGAFDEAPWSMNRAMYLNLPGRSTDAAFVCPLIAPYFSATLTADSACEYHAPPGGQNWETLTIANDGTDDMSGEVAVTEGGDWLSVSDPGSYTIIAGGGPLVMTVIMDASTLIEGLYLGEIQITHNDTSQASPRVFPIAFYVVDEFFCPEDLILRTAVASPGVVSLQVGSDGRFGAPVWEGGLWRSLDASRAINDATLLVAHGNQDPDTIVFHNFYTRDDPGQRGFRSLADLEVDTSAYGTGIGYALATAQMTTTDSVLGITATWFFPQHPDSADFVIVEYGVTNRTLSPIADIAVGLYADLDVLAAAHIQHVQVDPKANHGYYVTDWNLIYQYGYDSIGHTPSDYLNSTQRYSAGFTYIAGRDWATGGLPFANEMTPMRGFVGDNRDNLSGGGPSSGLLYTTLTGPSGVTVWEPMAHADSMKDAYTALTLDQGLTLEPGQTQVYIVGCVSDTLAHSQYSPPPVKSLGASSLEDVVQRAWEWAAANVVCRCDCGADPQCDGVVNILDVVRAVDVAFRDQPPVVERPCPVPRTDVTCDGVTDVLDVVRFVEVAFRDGNPEALFCNPCAP
ncbi:MAG TPA: hypothetical protein VM118_11150 [Acidobacteriota bacterium]|nr:hypothetical protein [Acidobacteriota bacterium]